MHRGGRVSREVSPAADCLFFIKAFLSNQKGFFCLEAGVIGGFPEPIRGIEMHFRRQTPRIQAVDSRFSKKSALFGSLFQFLTLLSLGLVFVFCPCFQLNCLFAA